MFDGDDGSVVDIGGGVERFDDMCWIIESIEKGFMGAGRVEEGGMGSCAKGFGG